MKRLLQASPSAIDRQRPWREDAAFALLALRSDVTRTAMLTEPESEGGYCRSAVRYVLGSLKGACAMHAAGLGPHFLRRSICSLLRRRHDLQGYPIKVREESI